MKTGVLLASVAALLCVNGTSVRAQNPQGQGLYDDACASCHSIEGNDTIPQLPSLRELAAEDVLRIMSFGSMRIHSSALSPDERRAVAQFVSGKPFTNEATSFERGMCANLAVASFANAELSWRGWGNDAGHSRFQREAGGLNADTVVNLELLWAFGFPGVAEARAQPTVYGDLIFVGSLTGDMFALDVNTGCTHWSFRADALIRTAASLGSILVNGESVSALFFSDLEANAYALNAETGELLWKTDVDEHQAAAGTGSVVLHAGLVYVTTSGLSEEIVAPGTPDYPCCSFRGSVTALDANSGEEVWKTYTLPAAKVIGEFSDGREITGPAGVAIWSAPSVDPQRKLLYVATGNAYVGPPADTSNAIMALDLDNGDVAWITQTIEEDIWSGGCVPSLGINPGNEGCHEPVGPDFDFSATPVLAKTPDGEDILVTTQKSGLGYAFDPDDEGRLLWTYRWGEGTFAGGAYGVAVDDAKVYFPVSDRGMSEPGGVHAVDLQSGERVWYAPPATPLCGNAPGCSAVQSAAATVIPGVVFTGSIDGGLRAYDAATGEVLWLFDTNRPFPTVNGVEASGGSIDIGGPVVAHGMVFVSAGGGGRTGTAGNVLLAFGLPSAVD